MKQWIDKLRQERTLTPEEFRQLLTGCDAEILRYINKQAQEVALLHFGNKIYIRGLIEISNCCRNNCYYCGIRKGNPNIERYRLSRESIPVSYTHLDVYKRQTLAGSTTPAACKFS